MLVPGGILLDLRPGPPAAHVFAEGRDLGPIDERPFFARIRRIDRDLERLVAEVERLAHPVVGGAGQLDACVEDARLTLRRYRAL